MDQFKKKLKQKNAEIGSLNVKNARLEKELDAAKQQVLVLQGTVLFMEQEQNRLKVFKKGFQDQVQLISDLQQKVKERDILISSLEREIGSLRALID